MNEPSEDVYGVKRICNMMGGICWRTAMKEIAMLEKETGMKLLHRRGGRPFVVRRVYIQARMQSAKE